MASKKKVTIEVDAETLKQLLSATDALSELANALATGSEDAVLRARAGK